MGELLSWSEKNAIHERMEKLEKKLMGNMLTYRQQAEKMYLKELCRIVRLVDAAEGLERDRLNEEVLIVINRGIRMVGYDPNRVMARVNDILIGEKVYKKLDDIIRETPMEAHHPAILKDWLLSSTKISEHVINEAFEQLMSDYKSAFDSLVNKYSQTKETVDDQELFLLGDILMKKENEVVQLISEKRKEFFGAKYDSIVEKAAKLMVDDLDKGLQFINEQEGLEDILLCCEHNLEMLVKAAKAKATKAKAKAEKKRLEELNQRIDRLEDNVKDAYKKRNIVGYCGLGSFALGLLAISPFFLTVGACVIGFTYFMHTKAEKVRKELGELITKRDGVEFDPSVNPYELPIVAKIIKQIKEKKNKK